VHYETEQEALKSVEKGHIYGFLTFPSNFSTELFNRLIAGPVPTNESIIGSTISVQLDMSSKFEFYELQIFQL